MQTNQSTNGGVLSSIEALIRYQWKSLLVGSLLAIVLGLLMTFHITGTVYAAAVLFAFYLLISGIVQIANGFLNGVSTGYRVLSVFTGILSIFLSVVGFRNMLTSIEMLGIWVGFGFFLSSIGILSFPTIDSDFTARGYQVFLGILGLLFSIWMLMFPISSIASLLWVSGIFLVVFGIIGLVVSFQIKSATKDLVG